MKYASVLLVLVGVLLIAIALFASRPMSRPTVRASPKIAATPADLRVLAAETASAQCHSTDGLPDSGCTPGVTDPGVTQSNLAQTICVPGYTKKVRPPASYTNRLKTEQMQQYGFTGPAASYEEDHLISLELGGAPSDPRNLWPEPGASPNAKDRIEDALHRAVCDGKMPLIDAQTRLAANWHTAADGL